MYMNKVILTIAAIIFSVNVFAQTGSINGKIVDDKTGEPVVGANVIVLDSEPLIGTITDLDGKFILSKVPAGFQLIQVTFISYNEFSQSLMIEPGKTQELNIRLSEQTEDIEEVVVKGKAITRTDNAVIAMQRKSANLINAVSNEQMSRLGDSNAASALSRVTGVTVSGGKFVYVRGLSDRYMKVTLHGAEVPSLTPNRNTVQLDLFPSNILENMVVHKTFSAELPGTFTGGYVDIITKKFPESFTLNYSSSLSFNPKSNMIDEFISSEGGKFDWLGFDDGTRDVPEIAKTQIPSRYVNDDLLDEITKSFNKNMEPTYKKSFLNQSHKLSVGGNTRLFNGKIGYVAAISYKHDYDYIDDAIIGRYNLGGMGDEVLNNDLYLHIDERGEENVLWSALGNVTYQINKNNDIGLMLLRTQSGESLARYQEGTKNSDEAGMPYYTRTIQYIERAFNSAQLQGNHDLKQVKIDWISSLTYSLQEEPDLRFFTNHYSDGVGYEISQSLYPAPTRYYRDMAELNWDNKMDFVIPKENFGENGNIRFGAKALYKYRDFNERKIIFSENENSFNGSINDYFDESNLGYAGDDSRISGVFAMNSLNSDKRNSYIGQQLSIAAYGATNFDIGNKFKVNAGLRIEKTHLTGENKSNKNDIVNYSKAQLDNLDFLPALNVTYIPVEKMNVRAAYYRTIALPSFREIVPYASMDFVGDFVYMGNNKLKRTTIDNLDIRWEFYPGIGQIASIGLFYKNFDNPIERTFNVEAANPELTVRNVDFARVYGIELEVRKKLDFVGLKNFTFGGNVTFVESIVKIDEQELTVKREYNPEMGDTRQMFEQAPYVVNAFLSYLSKQNGWAANVAYNITGEKLYLVSATGVPDVYELPSGALDFNISKELPANFRIKFSVKNMLDSRKKYTYTFKDVDYIFGQYTRGRTFGLSLSYSFE